MQKMNVVFVYDATKKCLWERILRDLSLMAINACEWKFGAL